MADAANVWVVGPRASLAAGFLNPPQPEPLLPRDPARVGGYTLVGRLGVGGMGVAYLARDDSGREVALKLVHTGLAEHEEFRARFIREVAAARRVPGRHTARVVDADVLADPPWLATEYFRCWTLAQQVPRFGPLTVTDVGTLISRLAEALASMHTVGLVHRDLKPSNILLAPDGPRIIDFGIARAADLESLTATGRLTGTPGYMAPEQIEGRETGPPADVFSLGASLVFATTGTNPFWDGSPTTLMYRTVHAEPDLGAMPEELRAVTLRCLAKDPDERPTAAELMTEFRDQAGPDPAAATEVVDDGTAEERATARTGVDAGHPVLGGAPAIDDSDAVRSRLSKASTERVVIGGATAITLDELRMESSQDVDFPPPDRRSRTGFAIGTAAAGLVMAVGVAVALADNGGPAASPPAATTQSGPTTASQGPTSAVSSSPNANPNPNSHPNPTSPTSSRVGSAIPSQPATPPPLPRGLIGYSGRLVGQNLAWFQSLRIPASSAPWSGGGLWSAITGPGCPGGTGHSLAASAGWAADPAHGGAASEGCDGGDLVASTVAPGHPATARVTWTFVPGTAVSDCAVFAYNATGPANLAFGDYAIAGRAGQFPMSGASHAGEWVELGVVAPGVDGTVTVGVGNDQVGDAQHPPGPTVTAAQAVAVCGVAAPA